MGKGEGKKAVKGKQGGIRSGAKFQSAKKAQQDKADKQSGNGLSKAAQKKAAAVDQEKLKGKAGALGDVAEAKVKKWIEDAKEVAEANGITWPEVGEPFPKKLKKQLEPMAKKVGGDVNQLEARIQGVMAKLALEQPADGYVEVEHKFEPQAKRPEKRLWHPKKATGDLAPIFINNQPTKPPGKLSDENAWGNMMVTQHTKQPKTACCGPCARPLLYMPDEYAVARGPADDESPVYLEGKYIHEEECGCCGMCFAGMCDACPCKSMYKDKSQFVFNTPENSEEYIIKLYNPTKKELKKDKEIWRQLFTVEKDSQLVATGYDSGFDPSDQCGKTGWNYYFLKSGANLDPPVPSLFFWEYTLEIRDKDGKDVLTQRERHVSLLGLCFDSCYPCFLLLMKCCCKGDDEQIKKDIEEEGKKPCALECDACCGGGQKKTGCIENCLDQCCPTVIGPDGTPKRCCPGGTECSKQWNVEETLDGGAQFYGPKSDQSETIYAEIAHYGATEYTQKCFGCCPFACLSDRLSPVYHSEVELPSGSAQKKYGAAAWQGLLAYLVLEEHTNSTLPQFGVPDAKLDKLKD